MMRLLTAEDFIHRLETSQAWRVSFNIGNVVELVYVDATSHLGWCRGPDLSKMNRREFKDFMRQLEELKGRPDIAGKAIKER